MSSTSSWTFLRTVSSLFLSQGRIIEGLFEELEPVIHGHHEPLRALGEDLRVGKLLKLARSNRHGTNHRPAFTFIAVFTVFTKNAKVATTRRLRQMKGTEPARTITPAPVPWKMHSSPGRGRGYGPVNAGYVPFGFGMASHLRSWQRGLPALESRSAIVQGCVVKDSGGRFFGRFLRSEFYFFNDFRRLDTL